MKIDKYYKAVYSEDEKVANPRAYSKRGARMVQRISIEGTELVEKVVHDMGLNVPTAPYLSIGALWHLPRREHNESEMHLCVSGFTIVEKNGRVFSPYNFVISDNRQNEDAQRKAMEVLEYLENVEGAVAEYNDED